jgi:release factor glutamine methyltransferase
MLADLVMCDERMRGARALYLCTGSGALAVAAARGGAGEVLAVDISRRAVAAARINAALNRVRVRALRGSLFAPVRDERFDAIVSNPPYVPAAGDRPPSGLARAWDAGADGRELLDRIIEEAPAHLRPGGVLWLVQSSICGVGLTLERLASAGLKPRVAASRRGPLGRLLSERAPLLERRGLLQPGEREEELVAVRAQAPA